MKPYFTIVSVCISIQNKGAVILMMKCASCGNEQATGKFCGKCGSALEQSVEREETEGTSTVAEQSIETELEKQAPSVEQEAVEVSEITVSSEEQLEDNEQAEKASTEEDETVELDQDQEEITQSDEETDVQSDASTAEGTDDHKEKQVQQAEQQIAAGQAEQAVTVESSVQQTEVDTAGSNQASYDQTAEVKEYVQNYWSYFIRLLKNPTKSLNLKEDSFNFSLINFILLSISYGIAFIYIMKNTIGLISFEELPYMRIFFGMFVFSAIVSLASIFGTFLINKVYERNTNFKLIITQLGGLITPVIVLQIGTILFALGGSFGLTIVFLFFSILFAFLIFPSLLIFKFSKAHTHGQRVYLAAAVALLNSIFIYIIVRIVAQSLITEIFDEFSHFFRLF